ncbi:EAL domain-containing protein [Paraburkholderia bryophila]|uniref:EAL and HDOD domain-containing protein n=1 Tax=Paraburkholderia bryophila TaxID=420952 RepID=UPI00234BC033|nr:EAL domain-containing protein [Paraburkholderia bryophila]WCM18757.1 EAL domain-containing protein [Paraburkholderia bryophila]
MTDKPDREHAGDAAVAFVARQPVVDQTGRMVAYELLFRNGPVSFSCVTDDFRCTSEVIEHAIGAIGFESLLGGLDGYINCSADFLFSNVLELLPADQIVLEVLESCKLDDRLKKRCNDLRAAGFRIALDDVRELSPEIEAFLSAVDIVKLDWPAIDPASRQPLVSRIRRAGKVVLAEKVDSREEWLLAIGSGCTLVQGFYFSKPQLMQGRQALPNPGTVLQVLDLLMNDATDEEIICALNAAPLLAEQLLRVANCSGRVRTRETEIISLHHALAIAGTNRLFRWCSLLLYNHPGRLPTQCDPLVMLAKQRAKFMERAALALNPRHFQFAQTAYLTGMLSLLHVLHGQDELVFASGLPVALPIREALIDRGGEFGMLLLAAEKFERGNNTGISNAGNIDPLLVTGAYTDTPMALAV